MRNVALDLAVGKVVLCEVSGGAVIRRKTASALDELVDEIGPATAPACVALEACREAWHVCKRLEQWGQQPVLVDTTRTKKLGIGAHGRKNDRIDAEVLARGLEQGMIPVAHWLSEPRQQLRYKIGVRAHIVAARAELVTTIRGLGRAHGVTLPHCATEDFVAMLARQTLDESLRALIAPLVRCLEVVDAQARVVDEELRVACVAQPDIVRLASCPGVGVVCAASFVSVIDTPRRFRNAHQVEAYLGLVPREDSSGDRRRLGSITKKGNRYLRAVLVQAAWSVLRSRSRPDPLVRWARQLAKRRGKRIAVIGVARRLAGILWAMWRRGTYYDPAYAAEASARGMHRHAAQVQADAEAIRRTAASKIRGRTARSKTTEVPAACA